MKKEFLQHCLVKFGSPGKIFRIFIQIVCKSLEVMNTFLNASDSPRLKPKDINYLHFLSQVNIDLLGREEKAKEWKEKQEEISNINNLNKFLTCNEIEAVSTMERSWSNGFTTEFCQTFKKDLIPTSPSCFTEPKGTLPNSIYDVSITLIPKADKEATAKKTTGQPL